MPRRFAAQLVLLVLGVMLFSQAAYLIHTIDEQADYVDEALRSQGHALAGSIAANASANLVEKDFDSLEQLLRQSIKFPGILSLQIISPEGRSVVDIQTDAEGHEHSRFGMRHKPPAQTELLVEHAADKSALLIWQSIRAGDIVGWVRVEYSLAALNKTIEAVWWHNLMIGFLAPLFCAVAILLYLRRPLRQIRSATEFAQRLADSSGDQMEVSGGSVELEALIRSLNEASLSLAEAQRAAISRTEELRISEGRSRALLYTLRDGVVHIDDQGTILLVNGVIGELFGYEDDELIGQNISILMPEPYRSAHDGYLAHYLAARQTSLIGRRREFDAQRKDGSRFPIDLSVNEMVDDTGSTFIGVIRDITSYKAAQRGLEAALAGAQEAAETKSRFLANMSHEIRTPINAILGFSHLCLNLELPARGRDYVAKMRSAAESLLGIVNDILDISKIEAGMLEMESVPFSLGEVLHGIASLFSLKAREKGVELAIGALPGIPDKLRGDPLRLRQVLTNLMGNALKFTEQGEISLTVEQVTNISKDANAATVTLRFVIRDTGLGMTPEQQSRLFTAFTQADTSTTRKYGGTGLGLAISKQLVEGMGGTFDVASAPRAGSTFSFTACFGVASAEDSPTPARSLLVGKQVLVADDNAVMRTLITRSVEAFGCQVAAVDSGEAVLDKVQGGGHFDLILLDWHMAGLDGLATANQIRARGDSVPIILITGDEPEIAKTQAEENAIQAFLTKPISRSTLHDAMNSVLGGYKSLPALAAPQTAMPDLAGARILLVDDNDFNRQVGRELIELTGAAVETADDGAQAVAVVEAGAFDLVLMDLQMPVMDGYTAARILRERHPALPILALTAHAMVEERERVQAAGMNDILTKPILPDVLYAMLAGWLANIPRDPPVPADAVVPAPTFSAEPPPAPLTATVNTLDLATALTRFNGDQQLLERFLRLFRERNAGTVAGIGTAVAQGDLAAARRLTHTFKGGAGTIGLIEVQTAAARLEKTLAEAIQGPDDPSRSRDDFAALEAAWSQAQQALVAVLDTPAPSI